MVLMPGGAEAPEGDETSWLAGASEAAVAGGSAATIDDTEGR